MRYQNDDGRDVLDERNHFHDGLFEEAQCNLAKLNKEQRKVFDLVKESIESGDGSIIAIDAPGGTGKTFTLNTLLSYVRGQEQIAIATAMSAIAANLLPGGRTLHSKFNAPVTNIHDQSRCSIKENSSLEKLILQTKLIIIDEVTMASKLLIEALDRSLRDVCKKDKPFGGIAVVFSGDWRQCLPVIPKAGKEQILAETMKESYLWQSAKVEKLKINMRLQQGGEDYIEFNEWLLKVGEGREETFPEVGQDMIKIPEKLKSKSKSLEEFCDEIFPGIKDVVRDGLNKGFTDDLWQDWITNRAIICPTNDDCQEVNEQMIKKISENEFEWRIEEHGTNFTQRIILDEENGFVISHVPAHNDRMETTFYNDETNVRTFFHLPFLLL